MSFGRASNGSDVGTAEQSRYVDLLPLKLRASSHGAVGLGKRLYTLGASQRLASGPALHASGAVPYPNLCTVVETCDDTSEQDPDHRQMHHDLQEMAGKRRVLPGRSVPVHCMSLSISNHLRKNQDYENEDRLQAGNLKSE